MPNNKILIPLDGSTFAESALPAAIGLAENLNAACEIISVFEEQSIAVNSDFTAQRFKEWLTRYLDDLVLRIGEISNVVCTPVVLDGSPAARLVDYAKQTPADLMVMATHGRGALSRAWLGSVADHVLRNVEIPVLLVRADEDILPGLTKQARFRHIVVALDGSELAEQSLGWATNIARKTGASLTLLRAVEPLVPFSSPYLPHAVMETHDVAEIGRKEAERYLSDVKERLRGEGVSVSVETLPDRHPAQGILEFSRENTVDLIAIATHGRTGVARVVLGSVADKVVRGSHTAVLLIHPSPTKHPGRYHPPKVPDYSTVP